MLNILLFEDNKNFNSILDNVRYGRVKEIGKI